MTTSWMGALELIYRIRITRDREHSADACLPVHNHRPVLQSAKARRLHAYYHPILIHIIKLFVFYSPTLVISPPPVLSVNIDKLGYFSLHEASTFFLSCAFSGVSKYDVCSSHSDKAIHSKRYHLNGECKSSNC